MPRCLPSLHQHPAHALRSAWLIFRREHDSNQIQNDTKIRDFTAAMKGTLESAGLLPKPLTKEELAKVDQMMAREGDKLCLQRRGLGFQRVKRGPWENEEGRNISGEWSSRTNRTRGRDVRHASENTYDGSHPESDNYWVLMVAGMSLASLSRRKMRLRAKRETELGLKPGLLTSGSVPSPSLQCPLSQLSCPRPGARDFFKCSQ